MTAIEELLKDKTVRRVKNLFTTAGFPIFLVGGSVRDVLSGHPPDDLDFTTPALPHEIELILDDFQQWDAGKNFGTIGALVCNRKVEVTTFRADKYRPNDRHPVVQFGTTINEDLIRRDFTINAMAIDLTTGWLIDPYGGQDELRAGLLMTPGNPVKSMEDDPLRVLRAIRFASVRGLAIDPRLQEAIRTTSLNTISQERKTAELTKIVQAGPRAVIKARDLAQSLLHRMDLFGGFYDFEEYSLQGLTSGESTIFAFLASYAKDEDHMSDTFHDLRLPNTLFMHCRNVLRVIKAVVNSTGSIPALVREFDDAVLDDATEILRARFEIEQHFKWGIREKFRAPLPVDGHDIIGAGFQGPAIGRALDVVEKAFLMDPTLSTQDALALLR